ncbi:hypothetical protein ACFX12_012804 [Malus domestica]
MEELWIGYREHWWNYGVSLCKEEHRSERDAVGMLKALMKTKTQKQKSYKSLSSPLLSFHISRSSAFRFFNFLLSQISLLE